MLLFVVGCGLDYPRYSNYSSYSGFSSYFKKTTGTSNLTAGYEDPPTIDDPNDSFQKDIFETAAEEYLEGVVSDLEEVEKNADNAQEKIQAVVDAANFGFEFFHVRHVGVVFHMSRESNFGLFGYPEFSDFDYFLTPTKPYKPLFLDDQFAVDSYNADVRRYNREVADFFATMNDYIDDAKHYIDNCRNDYNEIHQKGLKLLSYIKSLDVDQTLREYPTDSLSWEATEINRPIKTVETNKPTVKDGVYCKPIFEIKKEETEKKESSGPIIKLSEKDVQHLK